MLFFYLNIIICFPDIKNLSVDLGKEQVLVETTLPSYNVQQLIESTGRRAVLMGLGSTAGVFYLSFYHIFSILHEYITTFTGQCIIISSNEYIHYYAVV